MLLLKPLLQLAFLAKSPSYQSRRHKPEPCKVFQRVSHVIFDLDGAVLNNHEMIDKACRCVFEKHKLEYTTEWSLKLLGMSDDGMWKAVMKELRRNYGWEEMRADYAHTVEQLMDKAPVQPGLERLMDHLDQHRVPMAAVSSSPEAVMKLKTAHIPHVMSKFKHVLCGDFRLLNTSKPKGDIFNLCATLFHDKPEPRFCLVFDDTPVGVLAAMDCCMQVIAITGPKMSAKALRHADEVLNNLNEFWPGKYGLPPFPDQIEPTVHV